MPLSGADRSESAQAQRREKIKGAPILRGAQGCVGLLLQLEVKLQGKLDLARILEGEARRADFAEVSTGEVG